MKVVLVDGSTVFRMGFRAALTSVGAGDISIAGEFGTGAEACAVAGSLNPDVLITELSLPDQNGIAIARAVKRALQSVRIVILTTHAPDAFVNYGIGAGADGYVLKGQSPVEVIAAIRAVHGGELVLPSGAGSPPATTPAGRRARKTLRTTDRLSAREQQIFELVVAGSGNKQIAQSLGITAKTVETHRAHIYEKLRVHTSADIVRLASLWGLIGPGSTGDFGRSGSAFTGGPVRSSGPATVLV